MGNISIISDIEIKLKNLLTDKWGEDETPDIVLVQTPKDIKAGDKARICLFLHQILENIYLRNEDFQKIDNTNLHFPPMVVDLLFLVIPFAENPATEKKILGKIMQIYFDNSILTVTQEEQETDKEIERSGEEIRLLFYPMSLDDLTKLWSALQVPEISYKLSLSYMVTPVRLDSTRKTRVQRVVSR